MIIYKKLLILVLIFYLNSCSKEKELELVGNYNKSHLQILLQHLKEKYPELKPISIRGFESQMLGEGISDFWVTFEEFEKNYILYQKCKVFVVDHDKVSDDPKYDFFPANSFCRILKVNGIKMYIEEDLPISDMTEEEALYYINAILDKKPRIKNFTKVHIYKYVRTLGHISFSVSKPKEKLLEGEKRNSEIIFNVPLHINHVKYKKKIDEVLHKLSR